MLKRINYKKVLLIALLFVGAYCIGNGAARAVTYVQSRAVKPAADENWGLSFQEEGKPPVANATAEYLKQFNA